MSIATRFAGGTRPRASGSIPSPGRHVARCARLLGALLLAAGPGLAFGQVVLEEGQATLAGDVQLPVVENAKAVSPYLHKVISGTEFLPTSSAMGYSPIGGATYVTSLPAGGYSLTVPVDLPPGSVITAVRFYVIDNDAANFSMSLRSYDPVSDAFITLESTASAGASVSVQEVVLTVDPAVVVSESLAYRLRVAPGIATTAHLLRGASIEYLSPVIFKNGFEQGLAMLATMGISVKR